MSQFPKPKQPEVYLYGVQPPNVVVYGAFLGNSVVYSVKGKLTTSTDCIDEDGDDL